MSTLDDFKLDGRRALVTGGAGGIGKAISAALAEAGAEVALLGRSATTEAVATELSRGRRQVHAIRADVSDRAELAAGFSRARRRLGGIDILVAAHGHVHASPAVDHDLASWDRSLETNLTSVFQLAQLGMREMAEGGNGKIITIASMLSFSGGLNVPAYAASKGGVAQLTKALANEWAALGINVNAIAPGYIKTALNQHIWRDDPERAEQVLARLPSGRWGDPDDIKGAAVFLASRASNYLHGVILPVDGGYLSR